MFKNIVIYIFLVGALLGSLRAQVVINEVSSANATTIFDEDGDATDWVELYNTSGNPVNLGGYIISDNTWQLNKWTFPGVIIGPNDYLTFFASGKDRTTFFNHWETAVYANDIWRFITPSSEPDSNWRISPLYNDISWQQGPGGIGYGDGDDNTIVGPPPVISVYMRRVFNIVDVSAIASAVLHMDYDDAFVAYLNGVEIARANIGQNGTPTPFNETAFEDHEAAMYAGGLPETFFVDEGVFVNGDNVLAIQIHNIGPFSSDLSAIPFLSLAIKDNSANYGPTPPWFNIGIARMHTNFKLEQAGEILSLSDSTGLILDQIVIDTMQIDNSIGRCPDGSSNTVFFGKPTPDSTNNSSTCYTSYVPDPVFSLNAGFYTTAQVLTISSPIPDVSIRYTVDGSIPDTNSLLYSTPINIDSTMVIRARSYHDTLLPSNIVTNSYFHNDSTSLTLPIISITTNPENLWDPIKGIYIKGPNVDSSAGVPYFNANFWKRIEIPVHIEYYDKQRSQGFEQDVGLKIFGNWSRSNPQKSFKIIARENYGVSRINYKLFPDKEIYSFKQFVLRNAGNDFNTPHLRDAIIQKLALENTSADAQSYQPCVVYLNGKYWGVYNIREKINEHYIANNHGVDPDSIDLLEYGGAVMVGDEQKWYEFLIFMFSNDLSDSTNYETAKSWLDIDNFIDYFAVEIHINNGDWLGNNVRYWRERKDGAKWRYLLWDLDFGFSGWNPPSFNGLLWTIDKSCDSISNPWYCLNNWIGFDFHAEIFAKLLLENLNFRNAFINRSADLINTIFTPPYFSALVYQFRDTLDAEMPRQFEKWGWNFYEYEFGSPGRGSYDDWINAYIPDLISNNANRQIFARQHIQTVFNLNQQVPVTLNVNPPNAGKIKINTVDIEQFPWAGIYFDSVPITITAIPNPGFTFSFWQSNIMYPTPDNNIALTFNPDTNDVFTAYFFGAPDTPRVTISEINYRSFAGADAGDWVELHNYSTAAMDLSGWVFKDGNDQNSFVIPDSTILNPDEYLVLYADSTGKFSSQFPNVSNVIGPFNFGLSIYGEPLRLYDQQMNLYLSATYGTTSPWPDEPNGLGWTLELLDPNGDLNDPSNWFAGCKDGSPGKAFTPCPTTDVPETELAFFDEVVAVYPNPVKDYFVLEINPEKAANTTFTFELLDIRGKKVFYRANIKEDELIIRNQFSPGLYIYKVFSSDGYMNTGKLIFSP
ncbi:CotH kinase family protein [bacterium AH-315-M05]|nr:CotH kinase family protein [bacterium AH-315-M05]